MTNFDNYTHGNKTEHNSIFFMKYSNDMQNVYKNIEDYNPGKKRKVLIVFDDMIADMINNKKINRQKIALNHSSDIDFKDFMKVYKKCTEPYFFFG